MNLRDVEESYGIFEVISFLILFLFFANGSWWITSNLTNLFFFGTYDGFYLGGVFLFLPILIIGFSMIKKKTSDNATNNLMIGYSFLVAGIIFFISSSLYIVYYVILNSSSIPSYASYELLNNLVLAFRIFNFVGYVGLFCSIFGLKRSGNEMDPRNTIFRLRFLMILWFLVTIAQFVTDILMISGTFGLEIRSYHIIRSMLFGSKSLIVASFLLLLCLSKFLQTSNDIVSKTGKIVSLIFLVSTAINFILTNINNFVIDYSSYYSSFDDVYSPMFNVIQLIKAVKVITLYLSIIIIGVRIVDAKFKRNSIQSTDFKLLSDRLFQGLIIVLLFFFFVENNYFMSKPKFGFTGVFLTIYLNVVSGFPIDALFSVYGLSYLIGTIMTLLLLIRRNLQQTDINNQANKQKTSKNLLVTGIVLIALSILANFVFRMFFFNSPETDHGIFISITVVKVLEVIALMVLGILFMSTQFKNYIRSLFGERSKHVTIVGIALIFQSVSGVGSILQNYYNLIAFPNIPGEVYGWIANITMLVYEVSTIMLITFVVIIALDSVKQNAIIHKVTKVFVTIILVIISVFKVMLIVAGFMPFSRYFDMLIDFQFQISASIFDGLAVLLFIYIVMMIYYGLVKRILEKNYSTFKETMSSKERITEFQH